LGKAYTYLRMEPSAIHKIQPRQYYRKFLEAGVRPSGRGLADWRRTEISEVPSRHAESVSLARVGNTAVMCGVRLEIGTPHATFPKAGRMEVLVTLKPICSSTFEIGADSEVAVSMGKFLTNLLTQTPCFDAHQLGIQEGKSCWVIFADCVCLDYDGNVLDVALLALNTALRRLILPHTVVDDDNPSLPVMINRRVPGTPFKLKQLAIPITFAAIDEFYVADPCLAEEELRDATWTLIYNDADELLSVYKPGGTGVSQTQMLACMQYGKGRIQELVKLLAGASCSSSTNSIAAAASSSSSAVSSSCTIHT